MKVEEIMKRIQEGEELFTGDSLHEETIWYEDGTFKASIETSGGCISTEKSEKYVAKAIIEAFNDPYGHDLYIGDDDLLESLRVEGE